MHGKNCISCQLARVRKTEGRGGVGLRQEKVAQTSWLMCWCTRLMHCMQFDGRCMDNWQTRLWQTGGSWPFGGQGLSRQAARGQLLDKAKADRRFVASGGHGQGRQVDSWTSDGQSIDIHADSEKIGGQGFSGQTGSWTSGGHGLNG